MKNYTYMSFLGLTLLLSISLGFPQYVCAQSMEVTEQAIATSRLGDANDMNSVVRSYDNRYEGLKGDPMAFEEFGYGVVYTSGGNKKKFQVMNYEAYSHEVATLNNGKMEYLPKGMIESFWMVTPTSTDTLQFRKFTSKEDDQIFFGQVLLEGKVTYIKKYEKYIQKADYQGTYSSGKTYDEFKDKVKFFAVNQKGDMTSFKPNKKGLESIFPEKQSEIKTYLKKNKPDLKSSSELAEMLAILSGE
ncbi:MAG: hypothetical protein AAFR66_15800 [Bacteroidota bacterium]